MDAKLVVVGGNAKPADIKLKLPVTIGRGRKATLVVPHPLVSRVHCEIYEADGYLVVRDLSSLNGTFINNRRITEAVLPPGELLTLGGITFRAVYVAGRGPKPALTDQSSTPSTTAPPEEGVGDQLQDQRRTADIAAPEIGQPEDEEARTEVADVDPEELAQRLRQAEQEGQPD
jgi:pSer/pThr/pTyr-binding forkhead associated (FHA) protein